MSEHADRTTDSSAIAHAVDEAAPARTYTEKIYLEDYEVGEELLSPARTITEADLVNYAGLTGDWHPLHTDATYAAETPFGERIAHGMLTLIIGSTLILRHGPYRYIPREFIAFYGIDGIRFTGPVKPGDTVRSVNTVQDIVFKDERRGILHYHGEVLNQRDEVVLVWDARMLVARRPAGH